MTRHGNFKLLLKIILLDSIICSVVCSGETLPEDLLHEFFEAFPPGITLLNYYGSTETTGDVTCEIYSSLDDMQGIWGNEFKKCCLQGKN